MRRLLLLSLCLLVSFPLAAETLYVSDELEITLRKGTSTRHEILRMLPSGIRLQVLETDKREGYTKVMTPGGVEGWVLSRFLMDSPAARERVESAEKRLAELELSNRKRMTEHEQLNQQKSTLAKTKTVLEEQNRKLEQQLAEIRRTASSALAIDSENKGLKSRLVEMERELQAVAQENETLKDRTARNWFMVGAGVVLLGIIIGLIIPRIRWRKRSSWDTF